MEDMPEYIGDISIRSIARSEDVPLEVNHSLLAQCEIDALRSEIQSLRYRYDNSIKIIRLLVQEIEYPAYQVDDVVDRISLIENAKKLAE
jgi:hypothetical protein